MFRTRLLFASLLIVTTLAGTATHVSAAQQESINFHRYAGPTLAGAGTLEGTASTADGALVLASSGLTSGTYSDPFGAPAIPYQSGSWTSPWYSTNFGFTELVASWNATTPKSTWLQVQMQATSDQGRLTKWYTMGIWASETDTIHRTSVGGQGDGDGYIAIDTFFAKDHPMRSYRLKVTLLRVQDTAASPTLRAIGAVASNAPDVNEKPYVPSTFGGTTDVLDVPRLSQEVHTGEYPEFDGGGEAWCSPTSTEMVVRFFNAGPTVSQLTVIPTTLADREVDYAAMHTYDAHYKGTGNWPFNTAYAASFGLDAEVTQLHSLFDAEQFIKAGIPVVASIAFASNQLPGFLLKRSDGHLLVIVGFTATGDVVVNDPAAPTDDAVRKVYDRRAFERAWLSATGGIVYVIHPASKPLPPPVAQPPNW